jgi:hypothetical protein
MSVSAAFKKDGVDYHTAADPASRLSETAVEVAEPQLAVTSTV